MPLVVKTNILRNFFKRRGPSNTTHWQHSFSDLAILTPREFCLYEYMKKCYWDLAVLFETGLPESLCQILPESLKLDPAGFSFKMQTFFDFFWLFLCKIYILDCNKGAWSRKTKKKLNLGRSRAVWSKIELWAKRTTRWNFFFNFLA